LSKGVESEKKKSWRMPGSFRIVVGVGFQWFAGADAELNSVKLWKNSCVVDSFLCDLIRKKT
jgi:hypothetical protein